LIALAAHHYWIAPKIYDIQCEYYIENRLSMMQHFHDSIVYFQTMDGRNDKANNQCRLKNRKHNNHDGGLSIDEQGSNAKEEEEEEGDRPHQRCHVDEANNGDPGENLEVPREIDFEGDLG
jgi:hypothetical protein